jgi:hypothetical protein
MRAGLPGLKALRDAGRGARESEDERLAALMRRAAATLLTH